ncbi:MAG: hypothetical protein Q9220_004243 [cf. Caloplaca sp. 1 TL-2023]
MFLKASIVVLSGLICQGLAVPNQPQLEKRAAKAKRDLPATTFPPARLSSACSCILTAAPSPTTVVSTVVTTKTVSSACSVATPIVKNSGFETGSLAPWKLTNVYPPLPDYAQYLSLGVTSPGFGGSKYAFTVNNTLASSYVQIDISQNLTVCAGAKYKLAAKFYETDSGDAQETYVEALVDDQLIYISKAGDAKGPPVVWTNLSGTFTAASAMPVLTIRFAATNYLSVEWGVDNVIVTPA